MKGVYTTNKKLQGREKMFYSKEKLKLIEEFEEQVKEISQKLPDNSEENLSLC